MSRGPVSEYVRADARTSSSGKRSDDMLMKQYDAARLDESKDAAIIQVVEPAIEPDRRSSPKRAPVLVVFTVLGLLGGCLLALILWWKELLQFDPVAARRFEQLRFALTGREAAKHNYEA